MQGDPRRPGKEFVRRHHVHYDVREELAMDGEERRRVGYRIRLWGVFPENGGLPADAMESRFAQELVMLAEEVVPQEPGAVCIRIDRPGPALYDSRVVAGADELALDIRLLHDPDGQGPAGASEERCLKSIRRALEALGAQQRD